MLLSITLNAFLIIFCFHPQPIDINATMPLPKKSRSPLPSSMWGKKKQTPTNKGPPGVAPSPHAESNAWRPLPLSPPPAPSQWRVEVRPVVGASQDADAGDDGRWCAMPGEDLESKLQGQGSTCYEPIGFPRAEEVAANVRNEIPTEIHEDQSLIKTKSYPV